MKSLKKIEKDLISTPSIRGKRYFGNINGSFTQGGSQFATPDPGCNAQIGVMHNSNTGGMAGNAICRALFKKGYGNVNGGVVLKPSRDELDLLDINAVKKWFKMPAFVTDQFRILNTTNFVDSISNETDYYYIFVGLANPGVSGYGRNNNWDNTEAVSYTHLTLPTNREV